MLRRSDRNSSSIQPAAGTAGRLLALPGTISSEGFAGLKTPGSHPLRWGWAGGEAAGGEEGLSRKVGVTTLPKGECAATTPARGPWLVARPQHGPAGVCPI